MDEHKDHLRVATTTHSETSNKNIPLENRLYILNSGMRTTGSIQKLAQGAKIRSVRFVGEKGYLATERNGSPFVALDLRSPSQPRLAGTLKVNGSATYLHPVDNNHLIAIGRESSSDKNNNILLSMFDVSDLNKPKEKHKLVLKAKQSEALYNHKAFNYFQLKGLLAIPITEYKEDKEAKAKLYIPGVHLYRVSTTKGFALHGKVDHRDLEEDASQATKRFASQQATVQRSIFINDYFFSISTIGLKVNKLDNLKDSVQNILFP